MSASNVSKIHVAGGHSTRLSLNERFTAIATKPDAAYELHARSRSRSQSRGRGRERNHRSRSRSSGGRRLVQPVDSVTTVANRLLLKQLARKHTLKAALKLKRRSMRGGRGTGGGAGGANALKRGTVKALRVAPGGRPIRANTLSRVATMRADLINSASTTNSFRRRSSSRRRRSNSVSNISGRLGPQRPRVGGAAERVAQRRLARQGGGGGRGGRGNNGLQNAPVRRGRSRSRSRGRAAAPQTQNHNTRGRSLSRGRGAAAVGPATAVRRGRSRSRSRVAARGAATGIKARLALPVKARLGLRPGNAAGAPANGANRRRRGDGRQTGAVATGRVTKRRSTNEGASGRVGRVRGRSASRGPSRSRKGQGGAGQQQQQQRQQQQQQLQQKSAGGGAFGRQRRRARSAQRNGAVAKNGNTGGQQTQQRRGRSRSRGARGARGGGGGRGGRNLAKTARPVAKLEDLDKELEQYMATTKTDADYLLN